MTNERAVSYRGYLLKLGVREVDLGLFEPVARAWHEDSPADAPEEIPFDRRWLMSLGDAWQSAQAEAKRWVDERSRSSQSTA